MDSVVRAVEMVCMRVERGVDGGEERYRVRMRCRTFW